MKHLDTSVIWNKLTNIQANLDDKTMYLWCTLYLETSYLQYLNYNRTAKFSWDFSRTWLISESLPGLINGRENGLQWETRWLIRPLELTEKSSGPTRISTSPPWTCGMLLFHETRLCWAWNWGTLGKCGTTCNKVPQFQA